MSLIKFGSNVGNTGNTLALPAPRVTAPAPMAPIPLPAPVAATNTSPDIAALMARLQAAEAAAASEKARADAAEAARAAGGGGRGYSMKASEKGAISIYGVSTKFPVTLYAPHLVGIIRDLVMTGKATTFLRENAGKLSVKVDGTGQAGTGASETAVRALADELDRLVRRA